MQKKQQTTLFYIMNLECIVNSIIISNEEFTLCIKHLKGKGTNSEREQ